MRYRLTPSLLGYEALKDLLEIEAKRVLRVPRGTPVFKECLVSQARPVHKVHPVLLVYRAGIATRAVPAIPKRTSMEAGRVPQMIAREPRL